MDQQLMSHNNGGSGTCITYPNGEEMSRAIPTVLHCSNYKAEEETFIHASHIIGDNDDNVTQVVFPTGAFSVLQSLTNDKLPELTQTFSTIKSNKTVLQLIHSHCGVSGNEQADRLATRRKSSKPIKNHCSKHLRRKTAITNCQDQNKPP